MSELSLPIQWPRFARSAVQASVAGVLIALAGLLPMLAFPDTHLGLPLALTTAVAALAWSIAARHRREWTAPVDDLARLIRKIRAGDEPIEQLSMIHGGMERIAEQIQSLLRELREAEKTNKELQEELRQRVASRTNALERQIGSLRHQATRDTLTGLYNRRGLDEMLPQIVQKCLDDKKPLSLLMIDVDYFKALNDTLGHAAGDDLLRALGQIISSTLRDGDGAFRYGGDEFVVVLPKCDGEAASGVAKRLQSLALKFSATFKVSQPPRLSIGVCSLEEVENPTAEGLLKRGDQLLYAQKFARKANPASPGLASRS